MPVSMEASWIGSTELPPYSTTILKLAAWVALNIVVSGIRLETVLETDGVFMLPPAGASLCHRGFKGVSDHGNIGYSFTWTNPHFQSSGCGEIFLNR